MISVKMSLKIMEP